MKNNRYREKTLKEKTKRMTFYLKFPILLFLIILLQIGTSRAYAQSAKISLKTEAVPLSELFKEIEKKTDYLFNYLDGDIQHIKAKADITNGSIEELLTQILKDTGLTYRVIDRHIAISRKNDATQKTTDIRITGSVTDESGEPLIGVSITVKSSASGTVSDMNGNFSLQVTENAVLRISYIGYHAQEIKVGKQRHLKVVLQEDTKLLDEVVVVGFATQKKVNLTGAVGTVYMKDMEARPVRNASQMLQGLVPGLNVSQSAGGALDSNPTINIRGIATIGAGSTGSPLVLIDGMEGDINAINPQDIDNISVLKDASTASIYGSRAAFGVILVTTKKGKAGKTSITYNNNFRLNQPINMPDMVDSYRFALYFNDSGINSGTTPHFTEARIKRIQDYMAGIIDYNTIPHPNTPDKWAAGYNDANDNIDWYRALYDENSFSHEHNLSINGGSEKFKYFASGNYLTQDGFMKLNRDAYDRYTTTLKVNGELKEWLTVNFSLRYIHEDNVKPYFLTNNFYYDLARQGWPVLPLYDPNGYMYSAPSPALNLRDGGQTKKQSDWLYQQAQIVLEPIKNWKTFAEFNYRLKSDFNHSDVLQTYNHDVAGNPYLSQTSSSVYEYAGKTNYYNMNIYSEYMLSLQKKHTAKIMFGYQNELTKTKNLSATRQGIIVPDLPVLDLTSGLDNNGNPVVPVVSGADQHWATAGFFGRINYDYKNKYLLEFNLRYDGTSRYRRDTRWNWFPSVSAGWNLASENFMKPARSFIDLLKIRGSYGKLGNQNTSSWYPTYLTMPVTNGTGTWLLGGLKPNISSAPGLISSTLTWEKIENWNVGMDFSLFNNRLTGSLDYFIRKTLDMVGPAPELPDVLGTDVPKTNNTDLKTYGFEFSIGWRDVIDKVTYNARFNLSDSQTKIINYPNSTGQLGADTYRKGMKIGEIWGYETIGIAKSKEEMDAHLASLPNGGQNALGTQWDAGDIMYRDLNNDGKIDSGSGTLGDPGDMKIIGNSLPRFQFSFDLGVEWKGLSVSALFQGVMKKDFFTDSYYFWGMGQRGIWWATAFEEHMNYFRDDPNHALGQNMNSYYPRPLISGAAKNQQPQTRYLQDASYIRLKNLQIGYTIPAAITQKIKIDNLRFYLSGENLWTGTRISKVFDPETIDGRTDGAVVYPLFKVFSAGLSITF